MANENGTYVVYSDGGSRGNPGDAAYGWLLFSPENELITFDSRYLGQATNNLAEYEALLSALKYIGKNKTVLGVSDLLCQLDSELIVKQLNGEYSVKDAVLKTYYLKIKDIVSEIGNVTFNHVERKLNKHADKLVNITLDAQDSN
jgi:ribonuclease HI